MGLEIWSSVLTFGGSGILAWDAFQAPRRAKAKRGASKVDEGMAQQDRQTADFNAGREKPRKSVTRVVDEKFAEETRWWTIAGFVVLGIGFLLDLIAKFGHTPSPG